MKNDSNKKRKILISIGIVFMTLSITVFKDSGVPRYLMMGASLFLLGYAVYLKSNSSKD